MIQIIDAFIKTCLKYGSDVLPWAVAMIVVLTVGGIVLRVLQRR